MGLYLGSERMSPAISFKPSGMTRFKQGTTRSDDTGELTLPKVDFVPSLIIIWNIVEVDHKELAEEEGGEWDDSYIRYTHDGILLTAIYQNGRWISQGLRENSGSVYITNASFSYGIDNLYPYSSSGLRCNSDGTYSYLLPASYSIPSDENMVHDFTEVEFNYIMYE